MHKIISILILFSSQSFGAQLYSIQQSSVAQSETPVLTDGTNWIVAQNDQLHMVHTFDLDPVLRDRSLEEISAATRAGFIRVSTCGENFKIHYTVRGLGGGPLTGYIGYWATKVIGYTGIGTAGGLAVASATTTLGATSGIAGAAGAVVGAGAAAAAGAGGAGTTAAIATAATAAGGFIGGTAGAAEFVAGASIVAEGAVGAVAAVESASLTVGAILTACPFLP